MKRLIKKAEIYNGFNYDNNYYEIFKNPSYRDIDEIKEQDKYKSVRGIILSDGTIFAWPGEISHNNITEIEDDSEIDVSQFRFAWDGSWLCDCPGLTFDEAVNYIEENKYFLEDVGDINLGFYIIAEDKSDDYFINKKEKSAKLIKKSEIYDGFNVGYIKGNPYFEIFKNPTSKEIEDVKKISFMQGVRGIINRNNDMYIWPADIVHSDINKYTNISVNYFRFSYEPGWLSIPWLFDLYGLGGSLTLDEAVNIINNNKSALQQVGDLNMPFNINTEDVSVEDKNLNEWLTNYNLKKEPITARLIKKSNYKTLIIVDIQKNFASFFDEGYLNKVENIINQGWNNIIVVVDNIDGNPQVPEFIHNSMSELLYKQYGGWEQSMIEEYLDNDEIEIIEDDEVYKFGKEYIVRGNIHEFFQIPENMEMVFKNLQEATIIGGGDHECLDDIENALEYFGVSVKRNNSGIYGAWNKNKDDSWIEEISWIEV